MIAVCFNILCPALSLLDGMCDIKFGAYRSAMKLCTLRKMTHCKLTITR